ncbi:N-6 DNA methylase [Nocardia beijingensis]|uniref:N-6 DNA methylase n=1 Tax=Nocardia beijingensis TaxID=95162 RepID=UPI00189553BC|nr:N-6 DNA methylase [Nocardia beijingensis]MBF6079052.1 N-6 DNA methylase [Nocardia beijingensis]
MELDLAALVSKMANTANLRTEADLQSDLKTFLLAAGLNLVQGNLHEVSLEAQVGSRKRIDIEVGFAVIETKKDLLKANIKKDAEIQLAEYVRLRTSLLGQRYVGVLTDGASWHLYSLDKDGLLREVSNFSVNHRTPDVEGLILWLEGVLATTEQVAPTPFEVARRLGAGASSYDLDRQTLAQLYYANQQDPEVGVKQELWARLLATAYGLHFQDDPELFIDHTYLVIVAEIIAHAILGFDVSDPSISIEEVLTGELLSGADIQGVVDSDFFDWVIHVDGGESFLRPLSRRLSRFNWANVDHDILKVLYESVIEVDVRHELGEYYTPDWLADMIVNEVVDDPGMQRILDPSCGSGSFLFYAIRKVLQQAEFEGLDNRSAIARVTQRVFGIDIHPVAVTLARVTYILAIGRLKLLGDRGAISIPVYLGDALQWRQDDDLLSASGDFSIKTSDGAEFFARELRIPARIVSDVVQFDHLISELARRSSERRRGSPVPSIDSVLRRFGIHSEDKEEIKRTFAILCELHDERRNHIWGYYIRNLARPRWLSQDGNRVDVIVGNPPWLAYRYMPDGLKQAFRSRSIERNIWVGGQVANIQDLSAYFLVRAAELYLKTGGRFGMVMPAAALNRKQYAGFRAGMFDSPARQMRVIFDPPWDLSKVRARPRLFPVASCVVFGTNSASEAGPMPSTWNQWTGSLNERDVSWSVAGPKLSIADQSLEDSSFRSPYRDLFANGATLFPRLLVVVNREAAGPLGTGGSRVRVSSSRSVYENKPWKSMDSMSGSVEERFLYPAYFNANIAQWRTLGTSEVVIPFKSGKLMNAEEIEQSEFNGLRDWWRRAESTWRKNRSDDSPASLGERIDFQRNLTSQIPAEYPRIVYSLSGTVLVAARIQRLDAVIEQTLLWAAVPDEAEAYYMLGVLNSDSFLQKVIPHQARGQTGTRHFGKDIFKVGPVRFDPEFEVHQQISSLSRKLEIVAASVELEVMATASQARRKVREAIINSPEFEALNELVDASLAALEGV